MPQPNPPPPDDAAPEPFEINLLLHRQAIEALLILCPQVTDLLITWLENHHDDVDEDLGNFIHIIAVIFDNLPERNIQLSDGTNLTALKSQLQGAEENIKIFQVGQPMKLGVPEEDIDDEQPPS